MKKIAKRIGLVLLGMVAALVVSITVLANRSYDAPYPDIHASSDPAVIARGRYLAYGPAHCVDCHGNKEAASDTGEIALSGGKQWDFPFGTLRSLNITPDDETGVGGWTDQTIARSLRYGVGHDGRALIPMMPFANLSDDDLTAVVSFVRSQKPVKNKVVNRELNVLGYVLKALVLKPAGPTQELSKSVVQDESAEYGKYLVQNVANCAGCHTKRDLRTGKVVGPELAGGMEFDAEGMPGVKLITPNLTPDPKTGRITDWTEEAFVMRFHAGVGMPGTHMPWKAFSTMTDSDLKAIFRYLRTVKPVENAIPQTIVMPAATAER